MKKVLVFLFVFCFSFSFGQDFQWEFRFYKLQDYFRENEVKMLTLGVAGDSVLAGNSPARSMEFDQQGRLLRMAEYRDQGKVSRVTEYTYSGKDRIYSSKHYLFAGDDGKLTAARGYWIITTDAAHTETNELWIGKEGDTVRKNKIQFDDSGEIIYRSSITKDISYFSHFQYNAAGQMTGAELYGLNSTRSDSIKKWHDVMVEYDDENRVKSVQKITVGTPHGSVYSFFDFSKPSHINFRDSTIGRQEHYEDGKKITTYTPYITTYALYLNKDGMLSCLHKDRSLNNTYVTFTYEFHSYTTRKPVKTYDISEFITPYFGQFDIIHRIY